jgi:hypothetical protein
MEIKVKTFPALLNFKAVLFAIFLVQKYKTNWAAQ